MNISKTVRVKCGKFFTTYTSLRLATLTKYDIFLYNAPCDLEK